LLLPSKEDFTVFELVFHGREPELASFSKEFPDLQWASKHVRRLGPEGMAYFGGAPAELIILVISLLANIFTIADILAKRLSQGYDSTIRVANKEIQLKGVWKPEEIVNVLNSISKKISKEEAMTQIAEIKSAKITETREKLVALQKNIEKYEKLVETFNEIPKKKEWQRKKAEEYKKRLAELRKEADYLKSFIDFLETEDLMQPTKQ